MKVGNFMLLFVALILMVSCAAPPTALPPASTPTPAPSGVGIGTLNTEVLAQDWLITPHDLTFNANGNLLVAGNMDNRIAVLSPDGELLYYYELDEYNGRFENTCVATTSSGNSYALNSMGLYRLNADGTVTKLTSISHWVTHMCAGEGETLYYTADVHGHGTFFQIQLSPTVEIRRISSIKDRELRGMDRGPDNNFYAFSANTGRILKLFPDGSTEVFKSGFSHHGGPIYVAFTPDNTMFVADSPSQNVYEIDLVGNVTTRDEFRPYGEMLFLPDKSYYTLNIYESQLIKYDTEGALTFLRVGQTGRRLVYMPSGAFMGQVSGIGQHEYFPSGTIKVSSISDFSGDEYTRYIFDQNGNTYYFQDNALYSVSPLGTLTVINKDVGAAIRYYDESIAFSEVDQAVYALCTQGKGSLIMRYSIHGDKSVFYNNPHELAAGSLDVDVAGNVYYGYQRADDYSYHLLKIDPDGAAAELFSKEGDESGIMVISCAKTALDSYLVISPGKFIMYHVLENGDVEQLTPDLSITGVDYQGLETSKRGDVYMVSPGTLYRFAKSEITSPVSVSNSFQQITGNIGGIIDVVIPGSGFNDDTAVETTSPGCWIYQRVATSESLSFKVAVREGSIPGEYDIILHNAGQEKVVLGNMLRIGGD